MDENQHIWINWARILQRWGIRNATASFLEATGSLSVLVAQVLYLSQPLLSGAVSSRVLNEFALVLENPVEKREFISFLREAPSSGTGA
jgi:hypothetical protein